MRINLRISRVMLVGLLTASLSSFATADDASPSLCSVDPVFEQIAAQPELLRLGRDLFYDPILSGNREVACATCHHPDLGTGDGLALGIGDGGIGLGPKRKTDPDNLPEQRIPRNAQALFNLGYPEFSVLFHDGRVERLADGSLRTPLGNRDSKGVLPVLTAQAMFPVLSPDEMAGHYSENEIAKAVRSGRLTGPKGAHGLLADRVAAIPAYRERFEKVTLNSPLTFHDIAEALAIFMAHEWRADESAFDAYLCQGKALPMEAEQGRSLFYGKADCSNCHSGRFQTDHRFHAIAMPQIGPGKAERFETHARDVGRMRVTGRAEDAYRFRTPSLRNVALSAPYGHSGAYATLEDVVQHHVDPIAALDGFKYDRVVLPALADTADFRVLGDKAEVAAIRAANRLPPNALREDEVRSLIAFLNSLTDRRGVAGRLGVPKTVPSGLPVPQP